MTQLTIACVLVRGHVGYTPDYPEKLRAGVLRHDPELEDARWLCLTDQLGWRPEGWERVVIEPLPVEFAWWNKVRLFDPALGLEGRVVYLDLDVLPVASVMPIVHFPAHLALARHAGSFSGKGARRVVRRYNSSVMSWDAGHGHQVWSRWRPEVTGRLWGDQDWIATVLPDERRFPASWTPRMISDVVPPWPEKAKVVLVKKPKPHVAAQHYPWFAELWRT